MIETIYPTTSSQQGFLLGSLTASDSESLYVEQMTVPLIGQLDLEHFNAVWNELIASSEILRTAFAWNVSGEPLQIVLNNSELQIGFKDLSSESSEQQDAFVQEELQKQRSEPFDMKRPPLLKLSLLKFADNEHTLIWTHHHAILDGWSQMKLLEDFLDRYHGASRGTSSPKFGDFAKWLAAQPMDAAKKFWCESLKDIEPVSPLATHSSSTTGDEKFYVSEINLGASFSEVLNKVARENDLTIASVLLASWAVGASQYWNTSDVTIGVTVNGRSHSFSQSIDILGPLVNTIPIVAHITPKATLASLAREIQWELAKANEFSTVSAGRIHQWLGIPSNMLLFDSVVAVGNYPHSDVMRFAKDQLLHFSPSSIEGTGGRTQQSLSLIISALEPITMRLLARSDRVAHDESSALLLSLQQACKLFAESAGTINIDEIVKRYPVNPPHRPVDNQKDKRSADNIDQNSIEYVILDLFRDVLKFEEFELDDSFIEKGGHSILAIELLSSIRDRFNIDLTLRDLITAETPRSLSNTIKRAISSREIEREVPLPAIVPIFEDGTPFPLNEIQQAYWVGRQQGFQLGSVDSHLYGEIEIIDLDLQRLMQAWRLVIERHSMLRAVLTDDGKQRILKDVPPYHFHTYDFRNLDEVDAAILSIRDQMSSSKRSVTNWPLFEIRAALLPNNVTRLFISFDLLIGDAASWKILYTDTVRFYLSEKEDIRPLKLTFRDYINAVEKIKTGTAYHRDREYWSGRLEKLPSPPAFPTVRGAKGTDFERRQFHLNGAQRDKLLQRSRALGVTPSTYLLRIFSEVIGRFTDQRELLLNLTVFNRLQLDPEVNEIVGDFTSLSMTAVELGSDDEPVDASFRRLQRQLWEDLDHRLYSGLEVLRDLSELSGYKGHAQAPVVFTSTLELSSRKLDAPQNWKLVYGIGQTPQVLLDYQTFEIDGGIAIIWDAVASYFPPSYLDRMFDSHRELLVSMIEFGEYNLLSYRKRNAPREIILPESSNRLLHTPFVEQAQAHPDHPAIISDGIVVSYGALFNAATALAIEIDRATEARGLVAVVMEKGWEQVLGVLSALFSNRAFVPIDANWPPERVRALLIKTGACVVLTQPRFRQLTTSLSIAPVISIDRSSLNTGSLSLHDRAASTAKPSDLAYVIFTSGSTGAPKGVMIQHSAALNTILDINTRFEVSESDRVLALSPLVFDLSIYDIFGTLAAGGAVVVPTETERTNPKSWHSLLVGNSVTIWNSVPTLMELYIETMADTSAAPPTLRACLLSGDWIPLDLPKRISRWAPGLHVSSLGGATEGAIWSIIFDIDTVADEWMSIPYGFSLSGQHVEILNQQLLPCEVDVPGEICISGHGVALGYLGEEKLTARSFVTDRYGRRIYKTGDRGRLRGDGSIEFLGRDDGQVKINGHRVELSEVEAALGAVPGVNSAIVITTGEKTKRRLVGFFTGKASVDDARTHLSKQLPRYLIPAAIYHLATFPLSNVGKVDRKALAEMAVPVSTSDPNEGSSLDRHFKLIDFIREIVKTDIDVTTNLLSLGLTSIDVIRMLNSIEHNFSVRPSIETFYTDPSIRGLQKSIDTLSNAKFGETSVIRSTRQANSLNGARLLSIHERASHRDVMLNRHAMFPNQKFLNKRQIDLEAFRTRRSARLFGSAPIDLTIASRLLECLSAVELEHTLKFLYPSAGGMYGIDVFVLVRPKRILGLEAGVYRYNPRTHDLEPTVPLVDLNHLIHKGSVNAEIVNSASLLVFFVCKSESYSTLYGEEGSDLATLDAGYMGQLLCQHAGALGLGACPLHGVKFDDIRWLFDDETVSFVHLVACGSTKNDDAPATVESCMDFASEDAPIALRSVPLSPAQERLLRVEYREEDGSWPVGDSCGFLRPIDDSAIEIVGKLDVSALAEAISALISRQSALRTVLRFRDDRTGVQIVTPPRPYNLRIEVPSPGLSIAEAFESYRNAKISPTKSELFSAILLDLGGERYLLILSIHHLISDGWSVGIMYRELSELYNAIRQKREALLPPLHYSFEDFSNNIRHNRDEGLFEKQLSFWGETLSLPARELPFPRAASRGDPIYVSELPIHLPRNLCDSLRLFSSSVSCPGGLSGPIFAAIAMVLNEAYEEKQIDIGCFVPSRIEPSAESVIGFFTNTVVIRQFVDPQEPIEKRVSDANLAIQRAMKNQEVPIDDVEKRLHDRDLLGKDSPAYEVSIALNDMKGGSLTLDALDCSDLVFARRNGENKPRKVVKSVKLRWLFDEASDGIRGSLTYDVNCFSEAVASSYVDRMIANLEDMARLKQ